MTIGTIPCRNNGQCRREGSFAIIATGNGILRIFQCNVAIEAKANHEIADTDMANQHMRDKKS